MVGLTYSQTRRAKYIASGTVSPGKYGGFRGAFPLLECCALGPLHLAISVEQSAIEYMSELSISLLEVLSKRNPVEHGEAASGNFYNGEPLDATPCEEKYREDVISRTNCAKRRA